MDSDGQESESRLRLIKQSVIAAKVHKIFKQGMLRQFMKTVVRKSKESQQSTLDMHLKEIRN